MGSTMVSPNIQFTNIPLFVNHEKCTANTHMFPNHLDSREN